MQNSTEQNQVQTALRESEEGKAFLLKLSDALRPLSDTNSIKAAATNLLGAHLRVNRTFYADADKGHWLVTKGFERDVTALPAVPFPMSDYGDLIIRDFRAGKTLVVDDIPADTRFNAAERGAHEALDIGSEVAVPLVKNGALVAMLVVHALGPRNWSKSEIALLEETAERTWAAVERARAEIALRESEAKFRTAFETMIEACCIFEMIYDDLGKPVDWKILEANPGYERQSGLKDVAGKLASEVMPGTEAYWIETFGRVVETGEPEQIEKWHQPTGRWIHSSTARVGGVGSRRLVSVFYDITERKRAEIALRESEERFRQFAEASSGALWIRNAQSLSMEYVSPAIAKIYGVEEDTFLGDIKRWAAAVVPDDRSIAMEHIEHARQGNSVVHEFRIQRAKDHSFRWVRDTAFPLFDPDGRIERIGGIAEDVSQVKASVEHQGVLLAELQHRVRNIMAVIRSIGNRSATGASSVEDYRSSLEGRLMALARVQAVLTREQNAGASLRHVLASEIEATGHNGQNFELSCADIKLSPKAVEVLTLAFHELTTNAIKYGALSVPHGRLSVRWEVFQKRGARWLAFDWTEEGAPARAPSKRRGFGSELIEARIPYELGGHGKLTIEPGGARCQLEFPLKDGESILETDAPMPSSTFGGTLDMSGAPDLAGRTVLVVEDDYYMAADTAAALRGAGAEVLGPCSTEGAARELLETGNPTHAVIDLNLGGGGPRFELAELLRRRGVSFLFVTGYDSEVIPPDFQTIVRLQKPITFRVIAEAVSRL